MNIIVIVGIASCIAFLLTWSICELIEYFVDKRGEKVHYVYKSRKLNKTIDVDNVGE